MLSIRDLRHAGLGPISLDVTAGSCVAVVGASGAGKSQLLRAIVDLDPNDGDVRLDGARRAETPAPRWRQQVALVPAESGWWADDVGAHFADPEAARLQFAALGLPDDAMSWTVARLSTGERQRLALIRCRQSDPRILLLDEPTGALDARATEAVEHWMQAHLSTGGAVMLVTHDEAQARRLSAEILVMEKGEIVERRRAP